jgi:hypothetical protein
MYYSSGDDVLVGGEGHDELDGGPGRDRIVGGDDLVYVKGTEGQHDFINCGSGDSDRIVLEFVPEGMMDLFSRNCEEVWETID